MTRENAEAQPASPNPSREPSDAASSGFWALSEEEIKKSVQLLKEDIPLRIPQDMLDRWTLEALLWKVQERGS